MEFISTKLQAKSYNSGVLGQSNLENILTNELMESWRMTLKLQLKNVQKQKFLILFKQYDRDLISLIFVIFFANQNQE